MGSPGACRCERSAPLHQGGRRTGGAHRCQAPSWQGWVRWWLCAGVMAVLLPAVVLAAPPEASSPPPAPGTEALYRSRVDSFCRTCSEAFAVGDFGFVRKASRDLLEGMPRARTVRVLEAGGEEVFSEGEKSTPPSGLVQGRDEFLSTASGVWVKGVVRFEDKPVNLVLVEFPPLATPPATAEQPTGSRVGVAAAAVAGVLIVIALCVLKARTRTGTPPTQSTAEARIGSSPARSTAEAGIGSSPRPVHCRGRDWPAPPRRPVLHRHRLPPPMRERRCGARWGWRKWPTPSRRCRCRRPSASE